MTTPSVLPATPATSAVASAIPGIPPVVPKKRSNEAKWGAPIVKAGWTCIPNILIRRQRTLGLDSLDLNILLHLLSYWWEDENHPHPSKETLAQAMNVSASTIQRRIRAMEAGKLLKRIERRRAGDRSETNLYDLTPLRELLEPQALQELAERSAGHEKRRKRMTTVNVVKP
ncbi:TPA: helix-turn-helix domain-containing protein [Pseudomonas aeruginosa]|nr:helix-turn-helix domain-containing protein [Pseudomonas aeruginosa]MBG5448403.1 helix-turn-helix domain-containing protein [Pseudomonas aeruginosa]MBG5747394.1 helix-turn-helix domain-containing protein [Pseudomonas aeruginosa]